MIRLFIQIVMIILIISSNGFAQTEIAGKVIKIADGDTVTILCAGNEQKRIRLYGIDCPEKNQDFGNRAKQQTFDLIFGKQVRVVPEDIDRYGRTVGIIYDGNQCINEEIINKGLAWVYRNYCDKPVCNDWIKKETIAKENKLGLWSQKDPIPPWYFRHSKPQ